MIVNELISNALKHAFPEGTGSMSIEMKEQAEGEYVLMIGDDGGGISEDFDIKTSETLGLQLVKGLVGEQLGGDLELRQTPGTAWSVRFQTTPSPRGKYGKTNHSDCGR